MFDQLARVPGIQISCPPAPRGRIAEPDLPPVGCGHINRLRNQQPVTDDDRADALRWVIRRLRWEHRLAELEHAHAAADDGGPIRPRAVERTAIPATSAHGG